MEWIQNRDAPQRLLCMTGAAGAGKSALQQTIAERCTKLDIFSAAFFCSSTDPTRNTIAYIVPTIAYQIGLKHHGFRSCVSGAVKHDPKIFSRSLQSQMDVLIVRPFDSLRRSHKLNTNTFPYVILIDGLDECIGKYSATPLPPLANADDRQQAEDRQAELLAAIKRCIVDNNNLPFRVFIASRPEWAIRTALKPGGRLRQVAYHIELSDKFDASGDMCRYLQRRFEDIGLQIGDPRWFSKDAIETLVQAASGQFVYVATVYKYITERRGSPAERLKVVLAWTPHDGQVVRPFEALDRLYASILSTAKRAYEAVDTHHGRDFLLLFRAHHMNVGDFRIPSVSIYLGFTLDDLSTLLGLEARAEDMLFSDLRSLVNFEKDRHGHLRLHFDSLPDRWEALPLLEQHRRSLKEAVEDLPGLLRGANTLDDEIADFTYHDGWPKLERLLLLAIADPENWFRLHDNWKKLIKPLLHVTNDLAARTPEVAAIIFESIEKVKRGLAELGLEIGVSSSDLA
ncbi:hypothetical protein EST38_g6912 [Candolleomyces aberdarensis]|uniref:Nephrocystin 3-like N-terminal domain-containing protein n=1 Tax=Candolleomyces aberdarensis TaxID=2316362 RepID=A0A4Q2DGY6_9AGAR|nr:hypothetical protein EST38_g6912 [Candolleomyces aberdarensis]